MFIAALLTISVPFIEVPVAISNKPSTFQYTLQAWAPFAKITCELALVEKAPFNWMINRALGLPWASSVRLLSNVIVGAVIA